MVDEPEREPFCLPESTHTLLFTQPVCSIPFFYALVIAAVSVFCLLLALSYNADIDDLNIPAFVRLQVRFAQYMAILIALIMEDGEPRD